ncbi:4Fe-4S binding protein [Anaerofustis butyriciformans]
MKSKFYAVVSNNCVACGACMKVCPREAIKVKKRSKIFC